MHSTLSKVLTRCVTVVVLASPVLTAQSQPASAPAGRHSAASASAAMGSHGSNEMHQAMMKGMEGMQKMQPTGDADKDFATMMKMHHQQAVEMAKVEIANGKSPELKAMARKMMKDQQKEISQLEKWLAAHK